MIVRMKKVTVLVARSSVEGALKRLRSLGVMHINHCKTPQGAAVAASEGELEKVFAALRILSSSKSEGAQEERGSLAEVVEETLALEQEKQRLSIAQENNRIQQAWFQEWGTFSVSALADLKRAGVFVKLYAAEKAAFKKIPADKDVIVLSRKKGMVRFAFITRDEHDSLGFPHVELPQKDAASLKREHDALQEKERQIVARLGELGTYRNSLKQYAREREKKRELVCVHAGMAVEEGFAYLQGFCPFSSLSELTEVATKQRWGLVVQEPAQEKVPTLVRNPRWIDIIRPVFQFMGTVPGYKEYDISGWFLLFFSLFFAMLIGDAGYGCIFLGATLLARRKFKKAPAQPFFLFGVLSVGTILWGAVTGTWFGFEKIGQLPFLNTVVIDSINSFVVSNLPFMMHLCFFIGALHLTIAHAVVGFRFSNRWYALSQVGWISIIWTVFFLAGTLVLKRPFPAFAPVLGFGGVAFVMLFSHQEISFFKGMKRSLSATPLLPLKLINSFGDTLSYLRLFAVGYASVMVALSFNEMALAVGFSSVARSLGSALILVVGHALNITLGIMSVLVHGIRLNMLEFSGHLDMEWSGIAYSPFKE